MVVDLGKSAQLKGLKEKPDEQLIDGREYTDRLRKRYDVLHTKPKWATVTADQTSMESILADPFLLGSHDAQTRLMPDVIELERLLDANHQEYERSEIVAGQFHPLISIALVANRGSTLRFFTIDEKENPLLHKVDLPGLKPKHVSFTRDGKFVVATGDSRFIYIYDVMEDRVEKINNMPERNEKEWSKFVCSPVSDLVALLGDNGNIIIISSVTKRCISTLKMNGSVATASFSPDGRFLLTAGNEHQVYVWDMETMRCINKFFDDSGNIITSLAISPDSHHLVVGSSLGVANIYTFETIIQSKECPKPWKTLMNLTTAIAGIVWHPSSECFSMYTHDVNNGLRLVHIPSGHVYSNWPNTQMPLGLVKSISFNHNGSQVMIGSADGKCRSFALKHYRK